MLYICATPIGNLADITLRALEVLAESDVILCEDTRLSKHLLEKHKIPYKKLIALHEHNENEITEQVISWLKHGMVITQVSDAGTPGISDPGARLCAKVVSHGLKVSPLPGACAYISLLSVSGLHVPSLFYGFLPQRSSARINILNNWLDIGYAVCIYEAPHRILECVEDIIVSLGASRQIIMGRELTKQFETIVHMPAGELLEFLKSNSNQQKGEFALIIAPAQKTTDDESMTSEQINALKLLLKELPPKKAVNLTHRLFGGNKDLLYDYAIGKH